MIDIDNFGDFGFSKSLKIFKNHPCNKPSAKIHFSDSPSVDFKLT